MQMSKEEQAAFAHFSRDTARHEMTVLLDNGVYRHILFKRPGDSSYHFELVTYPGYLCFSGDMGCYVFSRLRDMVDVFRSSGHEKSAPDAPAVRNINPSYWSEKLQAVDGRRKAGFEEFSSEAFEQVVKEQLVQWCRDHPKLGREGRAELRRQLVWEVLDCSNNGEHEAIKAGMDFSEEIEGIRFQFDEFWDHDFTRYTHSFLWACFAIAWGVQRYDEYKAAEAATQNEGVAA